MTPRKKRERQEDDLLSKGAVRSDDPFYTQRSVTIRPDPYRTAFHRDYTRILHSRAFRRLRQKTQVFISPKNDHLCTRLEHSLHVASVGTTIARALGLNEDLVRAVALGHDLGHAPFGHCGERNLRKWAKRHHLSFSHELHSLRIVDVLECPYKNVVGLNLTFAVRDGIACHYGEGFEKVLRPARSAGPNRLKSVRRGRTRPATLEGCVVRWADKIAYLGRDLEDALDLDIVTEDQIPASVRRTLGTTNGKIIATLVGELVKNGIDDDALRVSEPIHGALNDLYNFSKTYIYNAHEVAGRFEQIQRAMDSLFKYLLAQLKSKAAKDLEKSEYSTLRVFGDFLLHDIRDYRAMNKPQLVIDFIAGMTDPFFNQSFRELFQPEPLA